jgi:tRNA pseudouridine55 synthase
MTGGAPAAAGPCGVLPVDKPCGPTSHDVVARVRRAMGVRRVGHAGTLDPAATGLLVILVGPATRLARFLSGADKEYVAAVTFGAETDSCDAEGQTVAEVAVPPELLDEDTARDIVAGLVGEGTQVPPSFSALKRGGEKAYEAARAGRAIELEPRAYRVLTASLQSLDPGPPLVWSLRLTVSKGTYVRAIARDLGRSLGTAAHLSGLRRTRSGSVSIDGALTLAEVDAGDRDALAARFLPCADALGLPVVALSDAHARDVSHGRPLPRASAPDVADGLLALVHGTRLLAVYRAEGARIAAEVVVPGGCS